MMEFLLGMIKLLIFLTAILIPIAVSKWVYNNFGRISVTLIESERYARTTLIRIVTGMYSFIWILIFMFPPQYHESYYSRTTEPKFMIIFKSDRLDYALAAFEIIGWAMIGFMIYFVWIRPYHTKLYKDLCERREVLHLASGGV